MISGSKRKRSLGDNLDCVREAARLKETPGEKDSDEMDTSDDGSVDRISQFPDHVIHHILSHLRNVNDAIRTSVLSKRWRELWYSYSVLIFDERKFAAKIGHEDSSNKGMMFRDYVSNSLLTSNAKNLQIRKLVLHMTSFDLLEDAPCLELWLNIAIYRNIKELDLHVGIKNGECYTLPQTVFSSKTLTGIRLSGCKLGTCNNIKLPYLQKLYLRKIPLVENFIQNLISCCHSVEDLRIIKCSGLKHLHVSNLIRLKRAEIHHCIQLKKVEISAPNLDTFWYCGKKTSPCKVSLEGCTSLKRLTLEHPQVTRDFCENQFSNFPLLEKLDLSMSNNKSRFIIISNPHLEKFTLKGCKKLGIVLVEAPNLLSFECKGETMPWVEIHPFGLTQAKLSFVPKSEPRVVGYGDKIWIRMKSFIQKFNRERFKLVLYSNKSIVIHEDLNNVILPPVPDLGCEIINSSACIDDALNSLLRKLHPVTLSIISPTDSKFPKLVYEMMKNKDKDPICCIYSTSKNKCWRHLLKDVNFEDLNDVKFEDIEEGKSRKRSIILGPWGGNGGNSWDDGTFTGVREIKLVYGHCIDSIQVVYDRNGKPLTAKKHGGVGGNKTAEVSSIITSLCFTISSNSKQIEKVFCLFMYPRLSCNSQMSSWSV
ncbi:Jacalin-related lectin 19 isoform J [Glycine soja]|uniref:Jacalin-related lectin 19 isoform H n=1 Tax=Glycine soja TaxID=3848 RepID=A0A445GMW7_GLYSO|nr:Jacalin-related lectin 19 isoform H [Glycine soja]RZB62610.1 Jacalin-related lectin 19 isoform I [Glycine soja]RZB62611.1 Jacalin-related lectin 19 isoform J [Glycine soja]